MELLTEQDFKDAFTTQKYFETERITSHYDDGDTIQWQIKGGLPFAYVNIKNGQFETDARANSGLSYYEKEYGKICNNVRYLAHNGWGTEPLTWNSKGVRNVFTKYHYFTSITEAQEFVQQWKLNNIKKVNTNIDTNIKNKENEIKRLQKEIDDLKKQQITELYSAKIIIHNYNWFTVDNFDKRTIMSNITTLCRSNEYNVDIYDVRDTNTVYIYLQLQSIKDLENCENGIIKCITEHYEKYGEISYSLYDDNRNIIIENKIPNKNEQ